MEEAEEDMVQAYLEKSKLEKEEVEIIRQRALKAQEEFEALEKKRNENREIHDKMKEEIKKMDQAVADSSTFINPFDMLTYPYCIRAAFCNLDALCHNCLLKIAFSSLLLSILKFTLHTQMICRNKLL